MKIREMTADQREAMVQAARDSVTASGVSVPFNLIVIVMGRQPDADGNLELGYSGTANPDLLRNAGIHIADEIQRTGNTIQ